MWHLLSFLLLPSSHLLVSIICIQTFLKVPQLYTINGAKQMYMMPAQSKLHKQKEKRRGENCFSPIQKFSLCWFHIAVMTNYHSLSGLNQHNSWIYSGHSGQRSLRILTGLKSRWPWDYGLTRTFQWTFFSLPFLSCSHHLNPFTPGLIFHLKN